MSAGFDLHNGVLLKRAISPLSVSDNTAFVSQIIDTLGFQSLEFLIAIGVLADVDATAVVLVEDGDDSGLSDAAAVVDAELLGTEAEAAFDFADDNQVRRIGYIGNKRFVRLTVTPAANAGAFIISALAILGRPGLSPITQPTA